MIYKIKQIKLSIDEQRFALPLLFVSLFLTAAHPTLAQDSALRANIPTNICDSSFRVIKGDFGESDLEVFKQPHDYADDRGVDILKRIPTGTEVLFNLANRTGEWSEITLSGGMTGWVRSRGLAPNLDRASTFNGHMRVKTLDDAPLTLRASADLLGVILGSIPTGEHVVYQGYEGYWSEILSPNQVKGFVNSKYLVCAD